VSRPHAWTDPPPIPTLADRIDPDRPFKERHPSVRRDKPATRLTAKPKEPTPEQIEAAMAKVPPPLVTAEQNLILKGAPGGHRRLRDRVADRPRPWLRVDDHALARRGHLPGAVLPGQGEGP